MTVKYLYELCKKEIEKGNGDRNIIICANDEYIPLENHFSLPYDDDELSKVLDEWGVTENEAIVLNWNKGAGYLMTDICLCLQYYQLNIYKSLLEYLSLEYEETTNSN